MKRARTNDSSARFDEVAERRGHRQFSSSSSPSNSSTSAASEKSVVGVGKRAKFQRKGPVLFLLGILMITIADRAP